MQPARKSPPQISIAPQRPAGKPSLVVEGSAMLDGRRRWLTLGEAQILETDAGKKLCLVLGATPHDGRLYLSMNDVRRLDLLDEAEPAAAQPSHLLPH